MVGWMEERKIVSHFELVSIPYGIPTYILHESGTETNSASCHKASKIRIHPSIHRWHQHNCLNLTSRFYPIRYHREHKPYTILGSYTPPPPSPSNHHGKQKLHTRNPNRTNHLFQQRRRPWQNLPLHHHLRGNPHPIPQPPHSRHRTCYRPLRRTRRVRRTKWDAKYTIS